MASVNKATILGHLGQDPEVKFIQSGDAVCNFSVATTEKWTDKKGEKQEKTEWHKVVVWGKLGELCGEYLRKGRQVYLEGKITTRQWEDRDKNKRYTTEIVASNVVFLGGDKASTKPQQSSNKAERKSDEFDYGPPPMDDDVPF